MNLKELKGMIAEEYSSYLKEQEEVAVDVQPDVDVDPMGAMGDEDGDDKDSEATLKTIYDMLSDYFEGEEGEDDDMDNEEPMDDVEGEEAPEADLEEFYPSKAATTTKSGALGAAGYKNFSKSSGHTGFGDSKSLNEGVERMQKLANIIK
jgi:hypothetical protein|tara:strand:+ start:3177 stop:3626 length:450 start_codon:yes stop_codon:yes gene_type:complete